MDAKTNDNDAPDGPGLPTVSIPTIDKRWISYDLQILRSGLLADAEIVCEGDATPRKVHRTILVGRSAWFKKAFTGDFKVVPEFGNLVLATLMTGSVSGAFTSNTVFQQWQDWCVTPPTRPPPQRERPALLGTPAPPVARGFGTVPPRVNNGFGTASPEVAGSGRGRGRRSGSGRGGGSGGGQWGFGSNWATPN